MLLVAVLGVGAVSVWSWANRPAPCEGANVDSERFGYCIRAPSGWRVAQVTGGELSADQLFRPDGDTTLTIQAIETGRDLPSFADDLRRLQADGGQETGSIRTLTVAGVDAMQWDATLASPSQPVRSRTVVFERDGVAWRVQFADSAEGFDRHVEDLSRMLESWQFR